ncbi:hypothetical protein GCM10029992_57940 [Glycomyces albus]
MAPIAAAALVVGSGAACASSAEELDEQERAIVDRLAEAAVDDAPAEETEEARQAFMAECMAEEDLEYLGPSDADSLIQWLGLTPEEFRAEYGFGHSTAIDVTMAYHDYVDAETDRYRTAFEAMSAPDRAAYPATELACHEWSYAEFGLPRNGNVHLPEDSPLNQYLLEASQAAAEDPRVEQATSEWSACMDEQGFDFADLDEMGLPLQQEAESFATAYAAEGQALVDAGAEWGELSVEDVLESAALAELEELQAREMAVAAADQACIDLGHDIEAVNGEVYQEHLAELADE